mgnify:FL=1
MICRHSVSAAPERYARISQLLGGRDETDCVEQIEALLERIELKTCLAGEGVKAGDVDWMTENAFKVSLGSIQNHPKVFTREEVKEIYEEALTAG